jgi:dUTP pyrophosphatase
MLKVKIELEHPNAKMPIKASKQAACWDVFAAEINQISIDRYSVNLGFQLEPPPGFKVVLVPRSSITSTMLIQQNSPGQGDEDYRGEYKYIFRMMPESIKYSGGHINEPYGTRNPRLDYGSFPFNIGDRVGQIYLEKVIDFEFEESILSETERGEGGFGSTGK